MQNINLLTGKCKYVHCTVDPRLIQISLLQISLLRISLLQLFKISNYLANAIFGTKHFITGIFIIGQM